MFGGGSVSPIHSRVSIGQATEASRVKTQRQYPEYSTHVHTSVGLYRAGCGWYLCTGVGWTDIPLN